MSNPLARRARIKDLSNKAEGIFQYVGNDNVLFRLISTGNKLTSDVNYAVALFTGFARSHQLSDFETRRTRYRMEGEEGTENWGCRLIGVDKLTGEKVEGPKVTVKMAKDAGWWDKNGSYWPKMTEMMLKYRAAAYFARAECPEVLMGANIDYEVGAGDAEEEGAAHA